MSYKTKPIDYSGCNEIIADHLRRGLAIECRCWDKDVTNCCVSYISRYDTDTDDYRYVTEDDNVWKRAEPIKYAETKTLKQPVELMKVLVDGGWKADYRGFFEKPNKPSFNPEMWLFCGDDVHAGVRGMAPTVIKGSCSWYCDESWLDTTLKPVE